MSNKYIPRMDEETLAFQLDEARKANCTCDQGCEGCPWALPNDKCLLLTAEHHISERYRERFQNIKRHYGKVSNFLMSALSIQTNDGFRLTRNLFGWQIVKHGKVKRPEVETALDLVKAVEEMDED